MRSDEDQIRDLVDTWMQATKSGDVDTVLSLMTDDAVFLLPGRPPMRKEDFASAARSQAGASAPTFEGHNEIQEIQVAGDFAYMWSRLRVMIIPGDGSARMERAGHTLTIFKREHGKWLLARDANLLVPVSSHEA